VSREQRAESREQRAGEDRLAVRLPLAASGGGLDVGLTVAGVSELLGGLATEPREWGKGAGGRVALASLLLLSLRRSSWRTPALAATTLSSIVELGATASDPGHGDGSRKVRGLLLGVRAAILGGLLREAVRADQWEATW
jgi:hypothetical protein